MEQFTGQSGRPYLWPEPMETIGQPYALEKQLLATWDEALFLTRYLPAVERAERLIADHDAFEHWVGHLYDALELVDWRSGEIRDRAGNAWLLEETLQGMAGIDQPGVRRLVKALRKY